MKAQRAYCPRQQAVERVYSQFVEECLKTRTVEDDCLKAGSIRRSRRGISLFYCLYALCMQSVCIVGFLMHTTHTGRKPPAGCAGRFFAHSQPVCHWFELTPAPDSGAVDQKEFLKRAQKAAGALGLSDRATINDPPRFDEGLILVATRAARWVYVSDRRVPGVRSFARACGADARECPEPPITFRKVLQLGACDSAGRCGAVQVGAG